jgi:hypothetical protein
MGDCDLRSNPGVTGRARHGRNDAGAYRLNTPVLAGLAAGGPLVLMHMQTKQGSSGHSSRLG